MITTIYFKTNQNRTLPSKSISVEGPKSLNIATKIDELHSVSINDGIHTWTGLTNLPSTLSSSVLLHGSPVVWKANWASSAK